MDLKVPLIFSGKFKIFGAKGFGFSGTKNFLIMVSRTLELVLKTSWMLLVLSSTISYAYLEIP